MVKMLISLMLPISIVEKQAWTDFMLVFDPSFTVPARNTIKKSIIPQMMNAVETQLIAIMSKIEWLNVCTDGWSDSTMRCWNGYVVQGIDDEWNMRTTPICLEFVEGKM